MNETLRTDVFQQFLDGFETEDMRNYCIDLLEAAPLNYWCWATNTYDCPGGLVMQTLVGCKMCNYLLARDNCKKVFNKARMRDSIRVAACFRCINKTDWIRNHKVSHDVKQGIKNYISDIIDNFRDCNEVPYDEDPKGLIGVCEYLSKIVPIAPEIKEKIQKLAIPDPELFFFDEGSPYPRWNFWLVYQVDKDYLYKLKADCDKLQEPLRTYLEKYL